MLLCRRPAVTVPGTAGAHLTLGAIVLMLAPPCLAQPLGCRHNRQDLQLTSRANPGEMAHWLSPFVDNALYVRRQLPWRVAWQRRQTQLDV
jgi:hypothetical protein